MSLIGTFTEENYYNGSQVFVASAVSAVGAGTAEFTLTFNPLPNASQIRVFQNNVEISWDGVFPQVNGFAIEGDKIRIYGAVAIGDAIEVQLLDFTFGNYQYTSIKDIVDNFMIAYVGDGKLIGHVAKSDVIFHAKRGLQEFSYDILKTVKLQEIELGPSLSMPMPQDYVNYVKVCYIDNSGVRRIIYPTRLTTNPTEPMLQDNNYNYVFDADGNAVESSSVTEARWKAFDTKNISGDLSSEDSLYLTTSDYLRSDYGQRYGATPETTQVNGFFTINERTGSFSFSSDLSGKVIVLEYISDGLGTDAEMKVNKLAEEALYKHIAYNILAVKRNISEYIVQRYKKERRAALRNAKIRLSNLKISEISQVMRNKSKQIKH
tara:strand:- start:10111 stop:11244 length:1134 start_codon:yes stop_codon:yes gene_type:complete